MADGSWLHTKKWSKNKTKRNKNKLQTKKPTTLNRCISNAFQASDFIQQAKLHRKYAIHSEKWFGQEKMFCSKLFTWRMHQQPIDHCSSATCTDSCKFHSFISMFIAKKREYTLCAWVIDNAYIVDVPQIMCISIRRKTHMQIHIHTRCTIVWIKRLQGKRVKNCMRRQRNWPNTFALSFWFARGRCAFYISAAFFSIFLRDPSSSFAFATQSTGQTHKYRTNAVSKECTTVLGRAYTYSLCATDIQQREVVVAVAVTASTHIRTARVSNMKIHCWIFDVLVSFFSNIVHLCLNEPTRQYVIYRSEIRTKKYTNINKKTSATITTTSTHEALCMIHTNTGAHKHIHRHISLNSRCARYVLNAENNKNKTKQTIKTNRANEWTCERVSRNMKQKQQKK